MVSRIFIAIAALLLPSAALAQESESPLEGHWAFRIDDATIFVFTLDRSDSGVWNGSWTRPAEIESNGMVFREMAGSQTVRPERVGERSGVVQLSFAGPTGTSGTDVLQFRSVSDNQALLTYVGAPGEPYPLIRVTRDTELGPFLDDRIYDRDLAVVDADYAPSVEAGEGDAEELAEADLELEAGDEAAALEPEELPAEEDAEVVAGDLAELERELETPDEEPQLEVDWQPLGLIDDATAAAAAAAASGNAVEEDEEPAPEADPATSEPEPAEADDAAGRPRIDADFLDDIG